MMLTPRGGIIHSTSVWLNDQLYTIQYGVIYQNMMYLCDTPGPLIQATSNATVVAKRNIDKLVDDITPRMRTLKVGWCRLNRA